MAAYECATWCMRMCARVCVCVRECVISEICTLLRVYAISLSIHRLYTYVMWDHVFVLTCEGDVASHGASDSRVK